MLALPEAHFTVAPDMRGYGLSEVKPVDATRGGRDWSDDLHSLVEALDLEAFHLVGWSLGGGWAMQYLIDHPAMLRSLTLIAPVSPYGFSGTKDERGTPCRPDYAGSGAGGVNPEFPKLVQANTREGGENPMLPQTRVVLERYKSRGGKYREAIFENCAHAPYIEKQDEFVKLFLSHLKERDDALL